MCTMFDICMKRRRGHREQETNIIKAKTDFLMGISALLKMLDVAQLTEITSTMNKRSIYWWLDSGSEMRQANRCASKLAFLRFEQRFLCTFRFVPFFSSRSSFGNLICAFFCHQHPAFGVSCIAIWVSLHWPPYGEHSLDTRLFHFILPFFWRCQFTGFLSTNCTHSLISGGEKVTQIRWEGTHRTQHH